MRKAEELAGVEHAAGGRWHPFERAWATNRKECSLVDVAAARGWKSVATLLRRYVQPDAATMLAVVTHPLTREAAAGGGKPPENLLEAATATS